MARIDGRRVHIAGSVSADADHAEVALAEEFVRSLVLELLREGATFVVPVDDVKRHPNDLPITFDWAVLETIASNLGKRPAKFKAEPLVVAIKHHKTEDQIPEPYASMYDDLRASEHLFTESAHHWNMASKRMDIQALHGDILITLGGGEGVLYLANLYHETGRPVIPLKFSIVPPGEGSQKLFSLALVREFSQRFFQLESDLGEAHDWANRLDFSKRHDVKHRVQTVVQLLRSLEAPTAFGVRLLNSSPDTREDNLAVSTHFDSVVRPFIEVELGYRLVVIDRDHQHGEAFINQEIFNWLHRAQLVVVDLTGTRPNCFIELGYALGRQRRTLVMAKQGTKLPFDIQPVDTDFWNPDLEPRDRLQQLRDYWARVKNRRSIVAANPLVP
jgi:hypothetical protein